MPHRSFTLAIIVLLSWTIGCIPSQKQKDKGVRSQDREATESLKDYADWSMCQADLTWSVVNRRGDHTRAIQLYDSGLEDNAMNILLDIQSHNQLARDNNGYCRGENHKRFWDMAHNL